jgi:hypothetical protein
VEGWKEAAKVKGATSEIDDGTMQIWKGFLTRVMSCHGIGERRVRKGDAVHKGILRVSQARSWGRQEKVNREVQVKIA